MVIVTWNAAQVIGRCLEALQRQTVQPEQVIVVDNHSVDETGEIVARFPGVQWTPLPENTGFARANNIAVSMCRTEWVALLNPDAFAEPDWLEHLMGEALKARPHVVALGSRQLQDADAARLDGEGDAMHWSGLIWRRNHGCPRREAADKDLPSEVLSVCAAAALYRRSAFERVGGFDEDFFCYGEDVDLGFRLRLAGYEAIQVPGAKVFHIGSALTGGRRSSFSVFYGQRNLLWIYLKNMPGWMFWLFLPAHGMMHAAQIMRFCLDGHCRTVWKAKIQALRGVPKMWLKRQKIQANREVRPMQIWQLLDKGLVPRRCKRP
ncbi:MAG: glycosyltransferase family 2 protein [Thiomonas sp.]